MTQDDWAASDAKSLGVFLNGEAISEPDPRGEKINDAKILLLFNPQSHARTFTLPEDRIAAGWQVVIDTSLRDTAAALTPKNELQVSGRAVVVLRSTD